VNGCFGAKPGIELKRVGLELRTGNVQIGDCNHGMTKSNAGSNVHYIRTNVTVGWWVSFNFFRLALLWLFGPSNQKDIKGDDNHTEDHQCGEDDPKATCGIRNFGFSTLRAAQDHDRRKRLASTRSEPTGQMDRRTPHQRNARRKHARVSEAAPINLSDYIAAIGRKGGHRREATAWLSLVGAALVQPSG
jgi:hypothetical protein